MDLLEWNDTVDVHVVTGHAQSLELDLDDFWQPEKILAGGELDHSAADDFIANTGGKTVRTGNIELSANRDGSFTVTNRRNGFTKNYPARKQVRWRKG